MSGSRGRGYRSPRLACPRCGRHTACSARLDEYGYTRLRRHNQPGRPTEPCPLGGRSVPGHNRQAPSR